MLHSAWSFSSQCLAFEKWPSQRKKKVNACMALSSTINAVEMNFNSVLFCLLMFFSIFASFLNASDREEPDIRLLTVEMSCAMQVLEIEMVYKLL